jgi:hypothetical protein
MAGAWHEKHPILWPNWQSMLDDVTGPWLSFRLIKYNLVSKLLFRKQVLFLSGQSRAPISRQD